jgi:hypothetical protein
VGVVLVLCVLWVTQVLTEAWQHSANVKGVLQSAHTTSDRPWSSGCKIDDSSNNVRAKIIWHSQSETVRRQPLAILAVEDVVGYSHQTK